ncbi:MAG: 4Fe-4S dicluster domain-containing protein [Desulfobulbaceae bacterium]|jgi:molybdopterin-containing oxidoreductase family iron-sulfur binding subunit|nr:4Fe-4S dicluster domain-containing protein [Desulfobulbaceae bacterium]
MDNNRRSFLKIAGITALAGIGAPVAAHLSSSPAFANSENNAAAQTGHEAAGESEKHSGVRLGMVIDMRKFYGQPDMLDKVIASCNKAHNIPHIVDGNGKTDRKSEIKWIWKAPYADVFADQWVEQSVAHPSKTIAENDFLVLCNHCNQPACVRVCPTKATFVLKENGIVAMDYHRCIGCRFCMMACPYGARSFNWKDPRPYISEYNPNFPTRMRGVVEKCTFCEERLALGQQPACVEAVQDSNAIVFGDLNNPESQIRQVLARENTIQRSPAYGTQPSVFYIV